MAEAEVSAGKHPDAVKLAQAVIDNHGPEITRLTQLMGQI